MASFIVFWEVERLWSLSLLWEVMLREVVASFMFVWEVMLRGCGLFHVCLGGYVERLWPLSCVCLGHYGDSWYSVGVSRHYSETMRCGLKVMARSCSSLSYDEVELVFLYIERLL